MRAAKHSPGPSAGELAKMAARAETNVLAELAYGTGGTLFENNNDLAEGFRQVAGAPEYLYLIGFTPEKLKLDGSIHALKVELKNQPGLKVASARRGYCACKVK
jgi:VWFA-related protein